MGQVLKIFLVTGFCLKNSSGETGLWGSGLEIVLVTGFVLKNSSGEAGLCGSGLENISCHRILSEEFLW